MENKILVQGKEKVFLATNKIINKISRPKLLQQPYILKTLLKLKILFSFKMNLNRTSHFIIKNLNFKLSKIKSKT